MEELSAKQTQALPAPTGDPEMPLYTADSELEKRARQVGTIAGQVVVLIREARSFLQPGERVRELQAKAERKAGEIRDQVAVRTDEWRRAAQQRSLEIGRRAKARYAEARDRTEQLGHDYPWHVLLAAGIAGLLLGSLLRVRRAHRAF